jgi:SAM-dependent MidA family methyltransferase
MEISLYQKDIGFYSSGETRTGTQGDFLTPVSTGPVLGQLLALQIIELLQSLKNPTSFHLVEQGADQGHLALDILSSLDQNAPHLLSSLHFHLIEPSPVLAQQQKNSLQPFLSKINAHWHPDLSSLPTLSHPAYFYSCELLDSFPVRIVRFCHDQWHERFVTQNSNRWMWIDQPASPELLKEIQHWSIPSIEGFTAEIRLLASSWLELLSGKIQQGAVLTLDYGLPAADLYHPSRSAGTLVALRKHTSASDPLSCPGEQDLTAHLNFSQLVEDGEKLGFQSYGPTPFMTALTRQATPLLHDSQPLPEKWTRNFQHLVHPNFFGQTHLALLQTKNLPASFRPSMFSN